ncbi:MAG TPA: hypothetical protein VH643_36015 [Gemmataceae bacterium]|jgi:YD repeat-containing protein
MKTSPLAHPFLPCLLIVLSSVLGGCQPRTATPTPQPTSRSIPHEAQQNLDAKTTLPVDDRGGRIPDTYDADGNLLREQHLDEVPYTYDAESRVLIELRASGPLAPHSAPNPKAP